MSWRVRVILIRQWFSRKRPALLDTSKEARERLAKKISSARDYAEGVRSKRQLGITTHSGEWPGGSRTLKE